MDCGAFIFWNRPFTVVIGNLVLKSRISIWICDFQQITIRILKDLWFFVFVLLEDGKRACTMMFSMAELSSVFQRPYSGRGFCLFIYLFS